MEGWFYRVCRLIWATYVRPLFVGAKVVNVFVLFAASALIIDAIDQSTFVIPKYEMLRIDDGFIGRKSMGRRGAQLTLSTPTGTIEFSCRVKSTGDHDCVPAVKLSELVGKKAKVRWHEDRYALFFKQPNIFELSVEGEGTILSYAEQVQRYEGLRGYGLGLFLGLFGLSFFIFYLIKQTVELKNGRVAKILNTAQQARPKETP